jgi:rod shape determining protein RodA
MLREDFNERAGEHFDWLLLLLIALIAVIGIINLYSATSVYTLSRSHLYRSQVYFLLAGGAIAALVVAIDYRHFERWGYVMWVFGVFTLALVFVLGKDIRGSSRWINIGSFGFQPSETMKFFLIVALGKYIQDGTRTETARTLKDLIFPGFLAAVPVLLVLKQPDLGTSLILFLIGGSMLALLRIRWQSMLLLIGSGGLVVFLYWTYGIADYQMKRITTFLSPESDITGAGYHAHNAKIAIGNGKLIGQGFMEGTQNQFYFLPDQYTDFPFPVYAEDWGFLGCFVLITIYGLLVLRAISIASQAKDRFGAAVAIGVGALVFWHAVFNIGMVTGLLPVVGVTLPLFSYGGTSLITVMMGLGLLMNISMRKTHYTPVRSGQIVFLS